jgi:excinuclease UvrABC nuclease subunit
MVAEGRSRRFAYPPNLFVVDGGAPQVSVARGGARRVSASPTSR